MNVCRVRRERASTDGWKLSVAAGSTTAALVVGASPERPFSAREAVDVETPARSATSARVAFRRGDNRLRKRLRR